jgi:hypothetical protein
MNIKQHIEAGHYPKDEKGRALVPVGCDEVATICATDAPGIKPILGFIRSEKSASVVCWCMWDEHGSNHPAQPGACWVDLLPPPPRKVPVKRYGVVRLEKYGALFHTTAGNPETARSLAPDGVKCVIVELTGSYEEPWS